MKINLLKLGTIFNIKFLDAELEKRQTINKQIRKLNELLSKILGYKVEEKYDKVNEIQKYLELQNNKLALFLRMHINFMYHYYDELSNDWDKYLLYCEFILTEITKIVYIIDYIEKDHFNKNKYRSFYNVSNIGFIN
jgi:hypothetical protein